VIGVGNDAAALQPAVASRAVAIAYGSDVADPTP
jgi:hypothetical protein